MDQGMFSVCCPGCWNLIMPPHMQVRQAVSFSAGNIEVGTVGAPITQGAGVLGIQGIGVNVPMAADVADAVAGKAKEEQTPKGGMFAMGLWSMMLPASMYPDFTIFGVAMKLEGAAPIVHFMMAPVTTCLGNFGSLMQWAKHGYRSPFTRTRLVFSLLRCERMVRAGGTVCG